MKTKAFLLFPVAAFAIWAAWSHAYRRGFDAGYARGTRDELLRPRQGTITPDNQSARVSTNAPFILPGGLVTLDNEPARIRINSNAHPVINITPGISPVNGISSSLIISPEQKR